MGEADIVGAGGYVFYFNINTYTRSEGEIGLLPP